MPEFDYDSQINPPGPTIGVKITNPVANLRFREERALIDTGASACFISSEAAQYLSLDMDGPDKVRGLGGERSYPYTYVNINILGEDKLSLAFIIEPKELPYEEYIIVGREILNDFKLLFDGPNKNLQVL